MRLSIEGTDFGRVASVLQSGGAGLSPEISRDVRQAARPMVRAMRQAIMGVSMTVSQRDGSAVGLAGTSGGGLRSSIAASVRVRPNGVGVIIDVDTGALGSRAKLPAVIDTPGRWRHPTLGNRRAYVTQWASPSGWFSRTAQAHGAVVVVQVEGKVGQYVRRVAAHLG